MQAYSSIFTRFLFFVIRAHKSSVQGTSASYGYTFGDDVTQRVVCLLDNLKLEVEILNLGEKYRRDTYPIQMLVIALLEEHPRDAYTDNYCYPIQRFLCLYHLQHDDGFQTVHTVTKTLASIQWVLRAVLYDNMDTTFKVKVEWTHAKRSK